jgi:Domain of unknown function (DUF4365)
MQLTDKMEELSVGFVEAVANSQGYFSMKGRDYGTDMHLRKAIARSKPGRGGCRYLTCQKQVDIQVKSTCERSVTYTATHLSYNLRVENYNDLVERANEPVVLIPLILVLFVFPDDENDWLHLDHNELRVRKCAYWYNVPQGTLQSLNENTQAIHIPMSNIVTTTLFDTLFSTLWP